MLALYPPISFVFRDHETHVNEAYYSHEKDEVWTSTNHETSVVDLRSVARRLAASDLDPRAWWKGSKGTVTFLADLIKAELGEEALSRPHGFPSD